MISTRAAEYIERFSQGCQKKTALKKLIAYREEAKGFYEDSKMKMTKLKSPSDRFDCGNYMNDMYARILALAEARDHLQDLINKAEQKKKTTMSAKPLTLKTFETKKEPEMVEWRTDVETPTRASSYTPVQTPVKATKKKTTKKTRGPEYYFQRTKKDFDGYDEMEIRYILRFQVLGMDTSGVVNDEYSDTAFEQGNYYKCIEAVEEYIDHCMEEMNKCDEDSDEYEFYETRVNALETVKAYFDHIENEINEYNDRHMVYNAGNDEYNCISSDDEDYIN